MAGVKLLRHLSAGLALASLARAACECGYLDPTTNSLWTDATITYFNESGLADFVRDPASTPHIYGAQSPGDTGTGQEQWAVIGDWINPWEESFGATYRSAVVKENVFINNATDGVALEVSTPDFSQRIVNGSQIVSRRRDMLYGTFRTYIIPTASVDMNGGSGFKFGVSYNNSETADIGIYAEDYGSNNYTLKWSYSATGKDATPTNINYTWVDIDPQLGLEHRIDWIGPNRLEFRNSGSNSSVNYMGISKGVDAFNLPSVPAPFSYQAWANGEPSDSAGPPSIYHAVTQILYARFFYNSSTPERQASFEQQCASVRAPICSTDDMTLRNSTAFSLVALDDYVEPHIPFKVPMYGIIAFSVAMGLLLILAFHTLVTRAVNVASRKRFAKAQLRESANSTPAPSGYLLDSNGKAGSTRANSEKDSWHKKQGSDGYAETNMEEILVARSASYIHGYAGSRNGDEASSVDHGSTLYHSRSAMFPTRSARESMSSRPASIASRKRRGSSTHAVRRANRQMPEDPSRDITDLDQLFDGWETDSDHDDEDEFANAEPISGNYERYDDWMNPEGLVEGDSGNSSPHLPHLPRHSSDADIMATHQLHKNGSPEYPSSPSSHKIEQEPASQIVRWHIREPETGATDAVGRLAEPTDEVDARAIKRDLNAKSAMGNYPSIFTVVLRKIDNFFFVARTTVVTSTGQRRIDYLDGMRGYACLFVSNGHFLLIFYPGIANQFAPHHHPGFEYWYRCTIAAITINPSLLLGTFFALPARTMCQRYLLKGGLGGMADATVRRIPRLMVPVIGAAVMNYFLMDNNAFKWVQRLNSRTWSIWSYWQNYDNVMVFVDAVITLPFGGPPEAPALVTGYATGVLWTIPVIIQGMWTCMIATVIAHEIKNHWKRFGFYFVIILFSWYANTWDMYFVSGLIVGDLDSKLRYREWAARGIPLPFKLPGKDKFIRVHGRYLAWLFLAACCVQQWLGFIPNAPGNDFAFKEFAIHPNWKTSSPHVWEGQSGYQGYTNPAVVGWFLIMGIFMVADLTPSFQKFFRLRIWHFLGIHSMSIYLLHGIIWWTWAAWLVLKLLERGVVYWAAVLCAWITGYILLIMFCIVFTNTFEVWATSFAKAWWRWVSGNLGRKE